MAIEDYYSTLEAYTIKQDADEFGDVVTRLEFAGAFDGYIGRPSSAEALRMGQRGIDVTGRLYASMGAPICDSCVIVEPSTGDTFQVASEPRDAAKRGHHLECSLREWRGGVTDASRA